MKPQAPSTPRRIAAAAAGALLALLAAAAAARADDVDVRLERRPAGEYEVQGLFFVAASSETVWGVLTDFERIPSFVPSMRRSRVLEAREDGSLLVEQEAVGEAFVLTKTVRVLLDVRREPERLTFEDRSGKDFVRYLGRWQTQDSVGGTMVLYNLRAAPNFFAPGFLVRDSMTNGARDLLAQVRTEILRRSQAALGYQASLRQARMDAARPMR